jgi:hypothetical protein
MQNLQVLLDIGEIRLVDTLVIDPNKRASTRSCKEHGPMEDQLRTFLGVGSLVFEGPDMW